MPNRNEMRETAKLSSLCRHKAVLLTHGELPSFLELCAPCLLFGRMYPGFRVYGLGMVSSSSPTSIPLEGGFSFLTIRGTALHAEDFL